MTMYLLSPIGRLSPFSAVNEPVKMFLPSTFFQARLILTGDDAITELNKWNQGAIKKDQKKLEEDGSFHMTMNSMERPKMFSRDLQELSEVIGGSLVRISYQSHTKVLNRGRTLSYRLCAIQVIEEAPVQVPSIKDPHFGFSVVGNT